MTDRLNHRLLRDALRTFAFGVVLDSWLILRDAHDPAVSVVPLFVLLGSVFIVVRWIADGIGWVQSLQSTEEA